MAAKGVAALVQHVKEKELEKKIEAQKKGLCMLLLSHCSSAVTTQSHLVAIVKKSQKSLDKSETKKMRVGVAVLDAEIKSLIPQMCREMEAQQVAALEKILDQLMTDAQARADDVKDLLGFAQQMQSEEAAGSGNVAVAAATALLQVLDAGVAEVVAGADAVIGTAISFRRLAVQINGYVTEADRMQQQHEESVQDLSFFTCRALLALAETIGRFPVAERVVVRAKQAERTQWNEAIRKWQNDFFDLLASFKEAECPLTVGILTTPFETELRMRLKRKVPSFDLDLFRMWMEIQGSIAPSEDAPAAVKDLKVGRLDTQTNKVPREVGYTMTKMVNADGQFVDFPEEDQHTIRAGIMVKTSKFEPFPGPQPLTSISVLKRTLKLCPKDKTLQTIAAYVPIDPLVERELKETADTLARRKALAEQGFNPDHESVTLIDIPHDKEKPSGCDDVQLVWKRLPAGVPVTEVFVVKSPGTHLAGLNAAQREALKGGDYDVYFSRPTFNLRLLNGLTFKSFRDEFYIGFKKHTRLYWDRVGKRVVSAGETMPKLDPRRVAQIQDTAATVMQAVRAALWTARLLRGLVTVV